MTTRRQFLKATSALALIPLANVTSFSAQAAEKVPLDDPAAKALKYVEDAAEADRADKMGTAGAEQFCDNCRFYTVSADQEGWGGCMLFQNRLVAAKGWCAGWVPTA